MAAIMAAVTEPQRTSPFDNSRLTAGGHSRDLPLLTTSPAPSPNHAHSPPEPMDISPSTTQPKDRRLNGSPSRDRLPPVTVTAADNDAPAPAPTSAGTSAAPPPVGAAAAAQQPKVVQAAFIHKLYNMLEDQTIQHLISWSQTNESFVMSPSTEFSKVLASYFKHTNISSFVRQLNMYGFHKVSDVFHAGSPDSPLWEFKHGGGSFKRGDLVGLREIKRRASRQTLIHRDSFSSVPKVPQVTHQPPPPPPEAPLPADTSVETRLNMLEYNLHDVYGRLARADDAIHMLTAKCGVAHEALGRILNISNELSSQLLHIVPDPEHSVHKDVSALRTEIARQAESLKAIEHSTRPTYAIGSAFDPLAPISPRHDTSRRPSLQVTGPAPPFRSHMAPLMASPRRQGSLSIPETTHSPSAGRSQQYSTLPPPPIPSQPYPHPLATVSSPPSNLSRRHTSADIRHHGWQGGPPPATSAVGESPYASGQNSTQWPSSPYRAPVTGGDQQLRDALASYELPKAGQSSLAQSGTFQQRHATPPPDNAPPSYANVGNEAGWQLPGPKFPFRNVDFSAPPTRRSSMASNVHSLLNPAETAEREGEDEPPEERKRKRVV